MSESAGTTATCPACLYDLRAATKEPDGRVRCAECGGVWDDAALQRGRTYLPEQPSGFGVLLMCGPGGVLPVIALVAWWAVPQDLTAAIGISFLLMVVYALIYSNQTTPPWRNRLPYVMTRTVALVLINLWVAMTTLFLGYFAILLVILVFGMSPK